MKADRYVDSTDPANAPMLVALRRRMHKYYQGGDYHCKWIKGINAEWQPGSHEAQLEMCRRIPRGSRVLEIGCGDGSGASAIDSLVENVRYHGVDLNADLWPGRGKRFLASSAEELPFRLATFDVVLSMFVIEHLVFPAMFLDEACRVLRPGGLLILIAPDFETNAMASERIGLEYGSGREKLQQRRLGDAALTFYDSRLRLPIRRLLRRRRVRAGALGFPVLLAPRCLRMSGFTPDCDAVYPASPEEIISYLRRREVVETSETFYRNRSTFGLAVTVRSSNAPLQEMRRAVTR